MKQTLSWFRSDSNKFLQDPVTWFPLYLLMYNIWEDRRSMHTMLRKFIIVTHDLHIWIKLKPPSLWTCFPKEKKISKCFKSLHQISDRRYSRQRTLHIESSTCSGLERWTSGPTQHTFWSQCWVICWGTDVRCRGKRAINEKTNILYLSKRKTRAAFYQNGKTI